MSEETIDLDIHVNGERVTKDGVRADLLLIDWLHEELGLTGTKYSCGIGACGSCKVALQEGAGEPMMPVLACFARLNSINGMHITTVEGLAEEGPDGASPNALQQAFLEEHAFQCGWSTPGFLMAATVLIDQLRRAPIHQSELDRAILEAIGGNICRCTGYFRYFSAIKKVILAEPGLVQPGDPEPVTTLPPAVSFSLSKRSGNDLKDKLLVGHFVAPEGEVTFQGHLALDSCIAEVSVPTDGLRTGEPVRDLNLRRFFFTGADAMRFTLSQASLVDHRFSLGGAAWGTPVPVDLRGVLSFGEAQLPVEHGVVVRVLSSDRLRVTSRSPLRFDMRALSLAVEAFASEFGLELSRDVEVSVDLELPYRSPKSEV